MQSDIYSFTKFLFFQNNMVGRSNYNISVWVFSTNFITGICNARSGISTIRLKQNLVVAQIRQLLFGDIIILFARYDIDIFFRTNSIKTFNRLLNHRCSDTQHIVKLLWICTSTERPESRSNSTSHYNYVIIIIHLLGTCNCMF